jgi:hypothetical protein
MLNTEELSRNAYSGVGFDSDEMLEQIFEKSIDLDIEEPLDRPKGHVMNKEEFMTKVRAHCEERDKRKALALKNQKKFQENDIRSYRIERALYQRRKARNSRSK